MRRKTYRIIAIMATALLALATSGCVDPLDDSLKPQPEEPTLTFWIKVPGSHLATKTVVGDVDSNTDESTIHNVQVWAFQHGVSEDDAATTLPLNYVDKDITGGFDYNPVYPDHNPLTDDDILNANWAASYKIQMPMPKEFILGPGPDEENYDPDYKPLVDIYILANWESIYDNKPQEMYLSDVRDMVFGAPSSETPSPDFFGTTTPTMKVPQGKGLPISAVEEGVNLSFLKKAYNGEITLTNDVFKREIGVIELERAVAKVRFAFARTVGLKDVEITKIEIGKVKNTQTGEETSPVLVCTEGIIPQQTYVFPHAGSESNPFPLPNGYTDAAVATIGSDTDPLFKVIANPTEENPQNSAEDISEVSDPEKLRGDSPTNLVEGGAAPSGMSAQQYDTYLNTNVTSSKIVYFRETGVRVSGLIHYKVGNETKAKDFQMEVFDNNYNNLHRNHYWIVYAYFKGGDLRIKPILVPDWVYFDDENNPLHYYEYKQQGEAHIVFSDKSQSLFGYGYTTSTQNSWMNTWNSVTVTSIVTRYNASADVNMGEWSGTAPTDFTENKYFWTRSKVTFSDGRELYTSPVAKSPFKDEDDNVVSITGISVQYASGTNASVAPETGWSNSAPSGVNNDIYVWSRTSTTYSDESTTTDDVCLYQLYKKTTEWYFRRQDWNSNNHEHDLTRPDESTQPYGWNDWVHSQMVVAPGLNAANVPKYSNRIELVTSYFKVPLYLKLTNPADFSIVLYHTESNSYEVFSDASVAEIPGNYYIEEGETKHRAIRSYFYVVPKNSATPGATTGVYLVTGTNSTDYPNPMKLPFNSDAFPGSQDYTEVYFYCVDEDTFQGYYRRPQPVNIKAYDKNGEVTL